MKRILSLILVFVLFGANTLNAQTFQLADIHGDQTKDDGDRAGNNHPGIIVVVQKQGNLLAQLTADDHCEDKGDQGQNTAKEGDGHQYTVDFIENIKNLFELP